MQKLYTKEDGIGLQDLKEAGKDGLDFAKQFQPHTLAYMNAKQLMFEDKDYSTPQDHYFGYIGKKKRQNIDEEEKEQNILGRLGIENYLPSDQKTIQQAIWKATTDQNED